MKKLKKDKVKQAKKRLEGAQKRVKEQKKKRARAAQPSDALCVLHVLRRQPD